MYGRQHISLFTMNERFDNYDLIAIRYVMETHIDVYCCFQPF